jgi:amino acid transporter
MNATSSAAAAGAKKIGLIAAVSIGVGGMIGAGIFSILGVVASIAGSAMWISFLIGGIVVTFSAYSYIKLGQTFPSVGGAVTFMVKGWGDNKKAGTFNVFQYLAYVISIALYATGFAAYAQGFWDIPSQFYAVGVIVVFTLINFVGSRLMGRAESAIVITKVAILIVFIIAALVTFTPQSRENLSPANWTGATAMIVGAGVLFVGYEGFGLITNAAANMAKPVKEIPRAIWISLAIVVFIYLAVSIGVVGQVPLSQLKTLGDSALAVAAEPALGHFGFVLISIAALLSTASAVNATLFGSANVAYQIAKNGGMPPAFDKQLWGKDVEGLFITAGLVIIFVLVFPLSAVASMGSAGFLLVYAAVNLGHLRIRSQTGAKAWPLYTGVILCVVLFIFLFGYMLIQERLSAVAMVATFLISWLVELWWRGRTHRSFKQLLDEVDHRKGVAASGT